ncbi:MAG TPA: outer membrane protein transport protein [Kofleriaceae bacterium]|nr:outer membrane protein transport protein [Kofleriaceae bacterium]
MRTTIIAVTILVPAAASAGGYFIPNESPRALSLSQSEVANEQGADALFLNIAALAGLDGLEISGAGELLFNQTDWSDSALGSAKLTSHVSTPATLAASYGGHLANGMGWGAGVGFGVPGGGSLPWPKGWAGQEQIQSVTQQLFTIGVGAAIQPLPYLKLGASFLRTQVVEELHQSINYLDHFGDAGLALSGGGNGFGLGLEVRVPDVPLSFGVGYVHSVDVTLEGNAHFTEVPASFQTLLHDQDVTEDLTVPNAGIIGAAYEVIPSLTVMGAVTWENWSVYKDDTFNGTGGFKVTVPRDYKDAYVFRLSGEYQHTPFLPGLTLRAGMLRSLSDQPKETVSPSLSDGNSWALSVGAGYNITSELRLDFGAQFALFDKVTATGTEAFPGSYDTKVAIFSFGASWRTDLGLSSGGKAASQTAANQTASAK